MDTSAPRLQIEPMTAQTVEAAARVERLCFSSPWSLESLAAELSNPLAVFRMIRLDGEIIGYAGMHHIIDEGYITNIAVVPESRHKGAAKALMWNLFDYAGENGLRMITLEVRESNEAARALYEKLEFKITGRRKNFYTLPSEDAIIMTREF